MIVALFLEWVVGESLGVTRSRYERSIGSVSTAPGVKAVFRTTARITLKQEFTHTYPYLSLIEKKTKKNKRSSSGYDIILYANFRSPEYHTLPSYAILL